MTRTPGRCRLNLAAAIAGEGGAGGGGLGGGLYSAGPFRAFGSREPESFSLWKSGSFCCENSMGLDVHTPASALSAISGVVTVTSPSASAPISARKDRGQCRSWTPHERHAAYSTRGRDSWRSPRQPEIPAKFTACEKLTAPCYGRVNDYHHYKIFQEDKLDCLYYMIMMTDEHLRYLIDQTFDQFCQCACHLISFVNWFGPF